MPIKFNRIETEDGNVKFGKKNLRLKKNALKILKTTAMKLTPVQEDTLKDVVEKGLADIKKVEDEKKVLKWQMLTPNQRVNYFLLQKYTDSNNVSVAMTDLYDNSEERINSGLNYEYHVYFPGKDEFEKLRIENRYVVSEKINDYKIGDIYYYHIPIYFDGVKTITDYGEEINIKGESGGRGLLWALSLLARALKNQVFEIQNDALEILQSFGFLDSSKKIVFNIIGGVLVEKYLLSIKASKKNTAIEYLNSKEGVIEDRKEKEDELKANELKEKEDKFSKLEKEQKEKDEVIAKLEKEKKNLEKILADLKKENDQDVVDVVEEKLEKIEEKKATVEKEVEKITEEKEEILEEIKPPELAIDPMYTVDISDFNYDDSTNLYQNLIDNGFSEIQLSKVNIINKNVDIEPFIFINQKEKNFIIIIDRAGSTNLGKQKLIANNKNRYRKYVEMYKSGNYSTIDLNADERGYFRDREISIKSENPLNIIKPKYFLQSQYDLKNSLKIFYNK